MKINKLQESTPNRIPISEHKIDESLICDHARKIIQKLTQANYQAYLVGGCVRDLLLGKHPKDFDVATNAHPEEICDLFEYSRIIGRRFRIVHVYQERNFIEVSTFRALKNHQHNETTISNGRILRDNTFGTIEEDALRRDFTINSMYYDLSKQEVLDFCNGIEDIDKKIIRMIGDDIEMRYHEDPVRILRALRFHAKLDLEIDSSTAKPIPSLKYLLTDISPSRLFDEALKFFHSGHAVKCFQVLEKFDLISVLFPLTYSAHKRDEQLNNLIYAALENTDKRIKHGKPVNPAFIFSILLWQSYLHRLEQNQKDGISYSEGAWDAGRSIVLEQSKIINIPKRFSITICEIWKLQRRFLKKHGFKTLKLLEHQRFRAAYDFMCLRAQAGELDVSECEWWTKIQAASVEEQKQMTRYRPKRAKQKS
ncbi:MAG: polynucleotide adenylyltransferase PcnB [Pseudomonadota bacterium]